MRFLLSAILCVLAGFGGLSARAQELIGDWKEVRFDQLSDRQLGALGKRALGIRSADWRHGETEHFVCHYFSRHVVSPMAVEAEFYFRLIAQELGKDPKAPVVKSHIFVFEQLADWQVFQAVGGLDPWTGGVHVGGELMLRRDPAARFKGSTLAHEITHLVVHRYFGVMPRWVDEGFAEYSASRHYAAFYRNRGYAAKPWSDAVNPKHYIPIRELTALRDYPAEEEKARAFYDESHRLVRFLTAADKAAFLKLMADLGAGQPFQVAFERHFGRRFFNLDALEKEFQPYASKDYVATP